MDSLDSISTDVGCTRLTCELEVSIATLSGYMLKLSELNWGFMNLYYVIVLFVHFLLNYLKYYSFLCILGIIT